MRLRSAGPLIALAVLTGACLPDYGDPVYEYPPGAQRVFDRGCNTRDSEECYCIWARIQQKIPYEDFRIYTEKGHGSLEDVRRVSRVITKIGQSCRGARSFRDD